MHWLPQKWTEILISLGTIRIFPGLLFNWKSHAFLFLQSIMSFLWFKIDQRFTDIPQFFS
jgi:hypothetical protein